MNQPAINTGYIVLADLSGFTTFVASSEVQHAQGILANLLGLLRDRLTPALQLAEVEGDALFLFAPDDRFPRGETLLELIEGAYVAFRDKLKSMERNASCPCQACRMIPSLDLKFVTHWGEYLLQDLTGASKPFGSCVNLAHRLLKNDITDNTGWQAYALFTEPALEKMRVRPDDMHSQGLSYPHLGECSVSALDLHDRYSQLTERRTSFLPEDAAHFTLRRQYSLSQSRVWELLTDAGLRNLWEVGSEWSVLGRPGGRAGPGATNHCALSGSIEEVLDWRPFDYYTVRMTVSVLRLRVTGELAAREDGTAVRWSMALESLPLGPLRGPACRFFAKRLMRAPDRFLQLDRLIESETMVR